MKVFLYENWQYLITIIGSAIAYVVGDTRGKRQRKANDRSSELENLKTVREMEKQIVDDVKAKVEELREINSGLQTLIDQKDEIIDKQQEVIDQQRDLIMQQANEIQRLKDEDTNQ